MASPTSSRSSSCSAPVPATRLRRLFTDVVEAASRDRTEVALLATATHPQVAPVLRRVTERRVGYVTACYAEMGFPPEVARRRGVLAFSAYLGHIQLTYAAPGVHVVGRPPSVRST